MFYCSLLSAKSQANCQFINMPFYFFYAGVLRICCHKVFFIIIPYSWRKWCCIYYGMYRFLCPCFISAVGYESMPVRLHSQSRYRWGKLSRVLRFHQKKTNLAAGKDQHLSKGNILKTFPKRRFRIVVHCSSMHSLREPLALWCLTA